MGVPAANIPIPGVMRPSMPSMPDAVRPADGAARGAAAAAADGPGGAAGRARARRHAAAAPAPRDAAAARAGGRPLPRAARWAPRLARQRRASVEQKLAAISAKGPEYEAIAKLSREIIEQVVWEVVPELAEAIIREHVKNKGI